MAFMYFSLARTHIFSGQNKGSAYIFYGSIQGIMRHEENLTPYYCGGPPDCTVIQNPDNFPGSFGYSVGFAKDVPKAPSIFGGSKIAQSAPNQGFTVQRKERFFYLRRREDEFLDMTSRILI